MAVTDYIEFVLAKLLMGVRGHEAAIFAKGPAFSAFPEPNLTVTSPDCGASGSDMHIDYTQDGKELFPELAWGKDLAGLTIKEWILICQDVDAPLPSPINHGFYYGIPAEKVSVINSDFEKTGDGNLLKGGFRYGANLRKSVYGGPRALKTHGPHRYYYQVIALKEPLDLKALSSIATKAELVKAVEGKVAGWGVWIGVSERKWT